MTDDRFIKDLTNKFFKTQLQHNDTTDWRRFPNHLAVLAVLATLAAFGRFWPLLAAILREF
jgi:hypothetical protein